MASEPSIVFAPFRLDLHNEQLWRDNTLVPVRPKPFAVLAYLATHPDRLVTATELREAVWPDTYVSEGLLRTYIREVRHLLDDDAEQPRFIETIPRRGYRFLPAVVRSQQSVVSSPLSFPHSSLLTAHSSVLVGRDRELAQLHGWLANARSGTRQVVFVQGEPGIGKTTLVDAFLGGFGNWEWGSGSSPPQSPNPKSQSPEPAPWIARGQCIEHYGAGEAYLPVLEALGQLCRQPGGEQIVTLLHRYAPTWLVQMPALIDDAEFETLQRRVQGATRERMLREMAEALEALTAEQPLVLVLEDLHWSDHSTLDLLTLLAQRRGPARLLVLATYRPADVVVSGHLLRAIKQELQVRGQCHELPLGFLTTAEVSQYLAARFLQQQFPAELAAILHQSTEGNPLFMITVVDDWIRQGVLSETEGQWRLAVKVEELAARVPESLRQMIEKQLERLTPEEQRMVEVASVVGGEFTTATVAAGLREQMAAVEAWCEGLAKRGQFLQVRGTETLTDGTVTGSYGFLHALYQQVLYERLAALRRLQLHRRIGEWQETTSGKRANEIAAELAVHFERGQDYQRAVRYLGLASKNAGRKYALQEVVALLNKGLDLLKTLPDTPERARHEINMLTALGSALMAIEGQAAPEAEHVYTRARALCQQIGETSQLLLVLGELEGFYLARAELATACQLGEQLLTLAQRQQDPLLLARAHMSLGLPVFWLGAPALAREHLESALALYHPQQQSPPVFRAMQDRSVILSYTAAALWQLGYPDQALQRSREAIVLAQELSHPFSLAMALDFASWLSQLRREWQSAREQAEAAMTLSIDYGFSYWLAVGMILGGWARAEQGSGEEGIEQMCQGLTAYRATRAELVWPYWLALLAEVYEKRGQTQEGLATATEALAQVEKTGERFWEAELHRLYGELALRAGERATRRAGDKATIAHSPDRPFAHSSPEASFLKAIAIARQQQAKSLELRAVMSLVRLRQQQTAQYASRTTQHETREKLNEAHRMLSVVYNWFTEGFDTADLQEAKALLEDLRETAKRRR